MGKLLDNCLHNDFFDGTQKAQAPREEFVFALFFLK
jgi:hypothetical protein